jgi:ABC-type transport system involved in cytochrome bd biosynthesis fused ATPase/permease subunit
MGALSDIDQAEKEAKNPPIFKKLFSGKSVEQEALEAYAAKKKAEAQRAELKQWMGFAMGSKAWDELIRMEGQIRKQRQETLYRQREKRQKFVEWLVIIISVITGVAILATLVWVFKLSG